MFFYHRQSHLQQTNVIKYICSGTVRSILRHFSDVSAFYVNLLHVDLDFTYKTNGLIIPCTVINNPTVYKVVEISSNLTIILLKH